MALSAWLLVVIVLVCAAPASADVEARDYVLGDVTLPDRSPFGPLPVRLQGAIAAPTEEGPHPLVVVVHGRHLTGCPMTDHETESWPCPDSEQRNDLGLRHVLRALAERGLVAVSPDVNGAYTEGWGEPDDVRRWPRIVNRTLAELTTDVNEGGTRFGIELRNRVDLRRTGLLGHSRSGYNAARFSLRRERGEDPLESLFLLAPSDSSLISDVPTAVVMGTCDFDTGSRGHLYLNRARNLGRSEPVFELSLARANHNFYNRTLSRLGHDDAAGARAGCRKARRLRAGVQQRWLAAAAADFFAVTLLEARRPAWLRQRGALPTRVYGRRVGMRRLTP